MDLTKINDLKELKSLAYDAIASKEQAERNLQAINTRIQQVTEAMLAMPSTATDAKQSDKTK